MRRVSDSLLALGIVIVAGVVLGPFIWYVVSNGLFQEGGGQCLIDVEIKGPEEKTRLFGLTKNIQACQRACKG